MTSFQLLYAELSTINPKDLCTTTTQVFHFVTLETFRNVLKNIKDVVLESVAANILIYKKEIVNLLVLMLPRLGEVFSHSVEKFVVMVLKLRVTQLHSKLQQQLLKNWKN